MKLNHLFLSFLFLLFFTTVSAQVESEVDTPSLSEPVPPMGPSTTIAFEENEFNFGKAVSGEKVWHTFVFTNTGNKPLVIFSAKGSCGCTVPKWPKGPIAPGESGEIFVVFDSKNKKGLQTKSVTISGNTMPVQTILYVKGEVVEEEVSIGVREEPVIEFKKQGADIKEEYFTAYPNPTSNYLNLNLKDFSNQEVVVDILNNMGQRVEARKIFIDSEDIIQVDVSEYRGGVYSVIISFNDSEKITKRFMVVR